MIATVRIAPIERWCRRALRLAEKYNHLGEVVTGEPVGILTEGMMILNGERVWPIVDIGVDIEMHGGQHMCEHMLEMD